MAEQTVIRKWSQDIEAMESEYRARWKKNLDATQAAFDNYKRKLSGDTEALRQEFEEFAKDFNADVDAIWKHIWGTAGQKQEWQAKHRR